MQDKGLGKLEIFNRFIDAFLHTLPKAIFIYLPVFAFFLWLFHNKQKWWFFDHGIFTLNYFSFLLLGLLAIISIIKLSDILPYFYGFIKPLIFLVAVAYLSIYFFVAHHRVYQTRKTASIIKGSLLFLINLIGLIMLFLGLLYASFVLMH